MKSLGIGLEKNTTTMPKNEEKLRQSLLNNLKK